MPSRSAQSHRWTADQIPDQSGRIVVITGANTGLGLEAARVLAGRGASVVLACRDARKASAAAKQISAVVPRAEIETLGLDLASLDSVRGAAQRLRENHSRIDLLINNAGLMIPPLGRTKEGFEQQFGVNHLGHFALTGLVLDRVLAAKDSRIVTVSSSGHRQGTIDFDDLQWRNRKYNAMGAYAQSKLANLMFTYHLQRQLRAAGSETLSVAGHPGISRTDLYQYAPGFMKVMVTPRLRLINSWFAHPVDAATLPILLAATDPKVSGAQYYGPSGVGEFTGPPKLTDSSDISYDEAQQKRLWEASERLTGVVYQFAGLRSS
ncbi:oxidoreductase [Nocardiopsis deserti]|uniref:oxidoreductase n=1 Tax=Nocardiopsis deserti TaxID=2605988 RepID=UPI00123AA13E|nr:oxidoreductase [Nocardiopsis deserti]